MSLVTRHGLPLQDCMVGLLFAFMPVLANNRSGGEVDHFDVLRLLFRSVLLPSLEAYLATLQRN